MIRTRCCLVLAFALAILGLGACASSNVQECGATGVLCPQGTHCAAAQGICIPDEVTCGNATTDPGEACDDGNTNDGDGCSADCKSDESCDNGVRDIKVGEVCDQGPTAKRNGVSVDGDGCAANCRSDESCGNEITDIGEVCDDGNDTIGDGCSQNCTSKEVCGNGKMDPGEACDPPNTTNCSPDCSSTLNCNNLKVDPGEECDEGIGKNAPGLRCNGSCKFNVCGDNDKLIGVEQCDAGTANTSGCDLDCTFPVCGDGVHNADADEACDNGADNGAANNNCSTTCHLVSCGNGRLEQGEACDDGSSNGPSMRCNACVLNVCGDGNRWIGVEQCDPGSTGGTPNQLPTCDTDCTFAVCGDGVHNADAGEACDNGANNGAANNNCSTTCHLVSCGNSRLEQGEQCDDGPINGLNGRCSPSCVLNVCGDGNTWTGVEQCDTAGRSATCDADCTAAVCGDGVLNEDAGEFCDNGLSNGLPGNACSSTCRVVTCGNGRIEQLEECDDGPLNSDNSRCKANCAFNRCGDGVTWTGVEQCDTPVLGIPTNSTTCDLDCTLPVCGDGVTNIDAGEVCDNGDDNGAPGNTCSTTCRTVSCGNGDLESGEECDDGLGNTNTGRCKLNCEFNRCGDGNTWTDVEQCDAGSTGGVPNETALCDGDCTFAVCGDGVPNDDAGEECDNGAQNGAPGNTCSTTCHTVVCGNGRLEQGEQCDDGAGNGEGQRCRMSCEFNVCGDGATWLTVEQCDTAGPSATCDGDCTLPVCGDGVLNGDADEACDSGPSNGTVGDPCSVACRIVECGNSHVEQGELCDDGANNGPGMRCTAGCALNVCGDGDTWVGVEQCDTGVASATCDADCTLPVCGDGVLNGDAGETCDNGTSNGAPGNTCSIACRTVECGNGHIEQGEACDDGSGNGPNMRCNACVLNVCGDGNRWNGVEQCDGGIGGVPTQTPTCDDDCTFAVCGDGVRNIDSGEACDNGALNGAPGNACSVTCQLVSCGNGELEQGEQCDDGIANNGPNRRCSAGCVLAVCGDGAVWTGVEQCDAGTGGIPTQTAACDTDCTFSVCGDSVRNIDSGEACDNGASNGAPGNPCSVTCQLVACGNGELEQGEQCDDGQNNDDNGRCKTNCTLNMCGDGAVWTGVEQCDSLAVDSPTCDFDCTFPVCGDGHFNTMTGEACDNGSDNGAPGNACSNICVLVSCGNGDLEAGEQCDEGISNSNTGRCKLNCEFNRCGDGTVWTNVEQCDTAGESPTCDLDCTSVVCGDSIANTAAGEDCDEGAANGTPSSLCSSTCQAITCGDGIVSNGEACDDSNRLVCGTCNADCTEATPPAAATGVVFTVPGDDLAEGETLVISDGTNTVTFTFTKTAVDQANEISAADGETRVDIATNIAGAISASTLDITAVVIPMTGLVRLTNNKLTGNGNVLLTETVVDADFLVFGMSDGQARDCAIGVGCKDNNDCGSGQCVSNVCAL